MTTDTGGAELFRQAAGERWLLPLKKITAESFHPGRAFAVAVALMTEDGAPTVEREMGQKKGRVVGGVSRSRSFRTLDVSRRPSHFRPVLLPTRSS